MNKVFLIILVISAILFVNKDEVETFVLRRRFNRRRIHHRDIYPVHHHYRPRRRHWYYYPRYWYNYYLPCMSGCTNIGNGKWGCQYPGNGVNECVFSRDCQGC